MIPKNHEQFSIMFPVQEDWQTVYSFSCNTEPNSKVSLYNGYMIEIMLIPYGTGYGVGFEDGVEFSFYRGTSWYDLPMGGRKWFGNWDDAKAFVDELIYLSWEKRTKENILKLFNGDSNV